METFKYSIFKYPEKTCPVPKIPDKAVITKLGVKIGNKCHFECIHGYERVQGSMSRTCLANGQWDGTQLRCSGNNIFY